MAERRMFAKSIIDSDAFLDMPLSTQALYFHLSMRADDEGFINNAKKIQRMIGSNDDDLKVLGAKKFIIPFETGVVVIKHWKIHNYIRGDRIQLTNYKDEKSKLDIKENGAYTVMSVTCQSDVSQMSAQDSIGKDSIGKDSIDIYKEKNVPYDEIINLFSVTLPMLSKPSKLSESRKRLIKARWFEDVKHQSLQFWSSLFLYIAESDFLTGRFSKWQCDFDWILKADNFLKITEGKYINRTNIDEGAPF